MPVSASTDLEIRSGDGSLVFRIPAETVGDLEYLVREDLVREDIEASPRRGLEIGGLIIGEATRADKAVFTVTGFEPVKIKYLSGPGFCPFEADKEAFEETLSRCPNEGKSRVIGYFRTHVEDVLEIRKEDRWVLRKLFGNSACCMMLVHVGQAERESAEPAVVHVYTQSHEIGKGGTDLEPVHLFRLANPAEAASLPLPAATRLIPGLSTATATRAAWRQSRLLKALGALVIASALFALGYVTASKRHPEPVSLGLSIQNRAGKVELRWNAASAAVKNAVRGSLVVVANGEASVMELDSSSLRAGTYEYSPAEPDLSFLIRFYQRDNSFVGEARNFHADQIAAKAPAPLGEEAAALPKTVERSEPATVVHTGIAKAGGQAVQRDEQRQVTERDVQREDRRSAFVPPPVRGRAPQSAPQFVRPPALDTLPQASQNSLPDFGVLQLTDPRIAAAAKTAGGGAPNASGKTVTFLAPTLVRRFAPEIPPSVRSAILNEVSIRIVAAVSARGRVTNAWSADAGGPVEKLLIPHAIQATRMWQFRPALRDGVPVPSETVVLFHFKP